MLRDRGALRTHTGTLVLAAASVGEFGPVLLMSVVASQQASYSTQLLLMLGFMALAVVALVMAARGEPTRTEKTLTSILQVSSQFAVRLSVLLMIGLVVLAG